MTVANLRGLKESGRAVRAPTYLYITCSSLLIVVGLYRVFVQDLGPIPVDELSEEAHEFARGAKSLSLLMLLRAFSSGAVALSGVEAVSNGVPAFQKPGVEERLDDAGDDGAHPRHAASSACRVLASHLKPFRRR